MTCCTISWWALTGVETTFYEAARDLSADTFHLAPSMATTLHGAKRLVMIQLWLRQRWALLASVPMADNSTGRISSDRRASSAVNAVQRGVRWPEVQGTDVASRSALPDNRGSLLANCGRGPKPVLLLRLFLDATETRMGWRTACFAGMLVFCTTRGFCGPKPKFEVHSR